MKISVNKVIRYIIAAILFTILFVNLYYTSSDNNKLTEPADLILSVSVPVSISLAMVAVLDYKEKQIYYRLMYVFMFNLIVFGGIYLSRSYWYKLDTFWSFSLSVALPGVLLLALILSPLQNNLHSKK